MRWVTIDRLGVDDGVAERLGLGARGVGDPHRGQAEGRLGGRDAGELADGVARVHRELVAGHDARRGRPRCRAPCMTYSCESSADVVVDAHRRDDHAELGGDLAADDADARAAASRRALLVDERDEAEADRELERVDRQRLERRRRAARRRGPAARGRLARRGAPALGASRWPCIARPSSEEEAADDEERDLRQARDEARRRMITRAGDQRRLALARGSGPAMSVPRSSLGGRAGDDDAGRDRDQQRRDLRDEAVADGQQREVLDGLAERHALLQRRRSTMPPIRLISDDDDAGDRVALDELRGAVHRAVEVGLARRSRRGAGAPRSSVIWPALRSASIAICLPGMASRVKRAPTSATRPAPLVIDDELDDDEDQEDDEADDHVAADDEVAERLDRPGRRRRAAGSAA